MGRYIYHNREMFDFKTVLDLGSGTGIAAFSAINFTQANKVIMTDYTEEIIELLKENAKLQKTKAVESESLLVDWTKPDTYSRILDS